MALNIPMSHKFSICYYNTDDNTQLPNFNQVDLNKKEIQLNLCNIFSILVCNKLYLFV